jgi:di/tricarboxylate transporter
MTVLAIWRGGRPIRTNLGDLPLAFGDALLLQGPRGQIPLLRTEPDLILLDGAEAGQPATPVPGKRSLALAIMGATLILSAFHTPLIGVIMLGGALLAVLVGILTMDQAYNSIEWRSIFLVAGMLPLGLAMTTSGAAGLLADKLLLVLGPAGPMALLASLVLLTIALTQAMHGAAVVAVMTPIAIQAAQETGLDPRALAMGVALASSIAFITPLGHPVNVLVMGPGGYRFRDFRKVGGLLTALLFGVLMVLLPIFWPLTAP